MSKHVLVTFGSKRGGTAEIAKVITDCLRRDGCAADCMPAGDVDSIAGYDAVIIGGALYMGRWHRDAWRFAVEHEERLRELPVWMFSSGPLDDSAMDGDISPTGQVAKLMKRVGARGHITFGGRLAPDAKGLIASAMAKDHAGDWRDFHQVCAWACEIATQMALFDEQRVPRRTTRPPRPTMLLALLAFVAVTALGGGALLVARPDGSLLASSPALLQYSGFPTFLVPGLLLLAIVGGGAGLAAIMVLARRTWASLVAFGAGTVLLVWIACEMTLLRTVHWLQLGYAAIGLAIVWLAFKTARLATLAALDRATAGRSSAYAA